MNPFDVAAVLMAIAAVAGYVNHRVLKLPATSGTLVVARFSSFVVVATEAIVPGLRGSLANLLGEVDFNQTASETGS
jgi:CPA1 family monovalent cation:H+ antiporter